MLWFSLAVNHCNLSLLATATNHTVQAATS